MRSLESWKQVLTIDHMTPRQFLFFIDLLPPSTVEFGIQNGFVEVNSLFEKTILPRSPILLLNGTEIPVMTSQSQKLLGQPLRNRAVSASTQVTFEYSNNLCKLIWYYPRLTVQKYFHSWFPRHFPAQTSGKTPNFRLSPLFEETRQREELKMAKDMQYYKPTFVGVLLRCA